MKKLFFILFTLATFVIGADVKPFVFANVSTDSASQQEEYNYMLQYKLYGTDYIKMGRRVIIPDKSGWNGSAGPITSAEGISLGGPVLTNSTISLGDQCKFTTGPIRAKSLTSGNDNGQALFAGNICLTQTPTFPTTIGISRGEGKLSCDSVPDAPVNLSMPTITWPSDGYQQDIILTENNQVDTIEVPEGDGQYDLYYHNIHTCVGGKNGCKIYIHMAKNRLTRIFVDSLFIGNHTTISVILGDSILPQSKYRGNVLIYSNKDIIFDNTDNVPIQGSFITTGKMYLKCNLDFAGQILANKLEIGDDFKGENFRFVKYDPDTLDFPELNKNAGLKENDSTVIIPIQLSDTSTIDVYFTYCFDLKDGVTLEDFNIPPEIPVCGTNQSITTKIPIGSKTPLDTIKVNIKIDTLTEPNEFLIMRIDSITGAILPNGETSGELKIKIKDAPNQHVGFDTTAIYKFNENDTGFVSNIKIVNETQFTRFYLDSSWTDRYTLDSITGELRLVKDPLDYEATTVDMIKVTLKDTGNVEVSRIIPIGVIDVNEAPTLNDTTFTLAENLPVPSIVGKLDVKDQDKNTEFRQNSFKIVEGDSCFTIDNNGRITTNKIFNYEKDTTEFKLKVMVYDKNYPTVLFDTATVTIKIGNTNEGPKFPTKDTTFHVAENTKPGIIGNVAAKDEDGDTITYKIVDNVPFTIDTAGNISSTREFDYEKETRFTFKVIASSEGDLTDTLKVIVVVDNINEPCNVNDTTFSIKENETGKIGNVNATDLDKDAIFGTLKYTISDSVNYQIDKDGNVFVKTPLNYEDKTVDSIKVFVTDGTNKDSATIKVNVINVPEDITLTGTITPVEENVEIGTPVGIITGVDGDSTKVTYTINTTDFKIDPITGVITTNSIIDYETQNKYPVTVTSKSTDGSTKDTAFVIQVLNVNEPVHINDTTLTVPENYTGPIGKVEGKDDDKEPVTYSVSDTSNYSIDSLGNITVKKPFDYEKQKTDTLIVNVTTPSGDKDSAIVTINIKNVNEVPVLQPNDTLKVPENCKKCVVGVITAIDPDKDQIKYTVKEPGFTIDSTGTVKTSEPLDYEITPKVTITVIAKDPSGAGDTATYSIKVTDVNEPVHTKDTTCTVKENYKGKVCKIPGLDEDGKKPTWIVTDTTNYSIDSTGQLVIKNPIDYEKKTKDTVKVIVTDGEFSDTATVSIKVIDEIEKPEITKVDNKPKVDTLKTNDRDHKIDYQICEGDKCDIGNIDITIKKDTTVKICNTKKTKCDSVVILFNDAPPVVTLTNAKSTNAYIDYITIEEQKDDKIYVNKKENPITVTVKDTVHKTKKNFEIEVKLDTIPSKDIKLKEYNYLIDETKATIIPIGGKKGEMVEVIKNNGTEITIKQIINTKTGEPIDSVQTISYTKKVNGTDVVVTYKVDNVTGKKIGDYEVSYIVDSCTKVTYTMNDKKKIVKNKEGNINYTVTYEYIDDFGNKASASVEIVYDDIPPKVEILEPYQHDVFKTNAIPVKWTVNGEVQDTLTLQRLEKGVNYVIRRYVDKAGNEAADTVFVMMKEAKAIDITLINPVTEIDQDKVDEFYSNGNKYNPKKPYKVTIVNPKDDSLPETIGVGFKIDIALPSVSATGNVSTLSDIIKNNKIPVDEKGNVVGASNLGISVEEYINENCTDDFRQDYHKNGTNIPLYNVKYNLHLWIYTSNANYVNDFEINYDIDSKTEANAASIANFVIDWIPEKDGNVKAKNQHSLGTGAYIIKLYSKSTAIYRCGFKNQKAGDKITKKEYNLKSFGYKRPNK